MIASKSNRYSMLWAAAVLFGTVLLLLLQMPTAAADATTDSAIDLNSFTNPQRSFIQFGMKYGLTAAHASRHAVSLLAAETEKFGSSPVWAEVAMSHVTAGAPIVDTEPELALAYFIRALQLITEKDSRAVALFRIIGRCCLGLAQYDTALSFYERAFRAAYVVSPKTKLSALTVDTVPSPSDDDNLQFPITAPFRLRHDLEQLWYVGARNLLPLEWVANATAAYGSVYAELGGDAINDDERTAALKDVAGNSEVDVIDANLLLAQPAKGKKVKTPKLNPLSVVRLTESQARRLAPYYNRVHFRGDGSRLPAGVSAVNDKLDWPELQRRYFASEPHVLAFDDFLSPAGLTRAYEYYQHSTQLWNIAKAQGYLGSYLDTGFLSPIIIQIAEELIARMPDVFCSGRHTLHDAWGYKYDAVTRKGIDVHADPAAVNCNFWIVDDSANEDPNSGGLVVYNAKPPAGLDFEEYNNRNAATTRLLQSIGYANQTIPYRHNRMVMFDSVLLHKTDQFRFRKGYTNRRINLTLLFGAMGAKCPQQPQQPSNPHSTEL